MQPRLSVPPGAARGGSPAASTKRTAVVLGLRLFPRASDWRRSRSRARCPSVLWLAARSPILGDDPISQWTKQHDERQNALASVDRGIALVVGSTAIDRHGRLVSRPGEAANLRQHHELQPVWDRLLWPLSSQPMHGPGWISADIRAYLRLCFS